MCVSMCAYTVNVWVPNSALWFKQPISGLWLPDLFCTEPVVVCILGVMFETPLTLAFIFSLMMNFLHPSQSPFLMALEAATMCSRIDSGGPTKA